MKNILNKIPVILKISILILSSTGLGYCISWYKSAPNEWEPMTAVITGLIAILIFGNDIFEKLRELELSQNNISSVEIHSIKNLKNLGSADIVKGDKFKGDKVSGNKIKIKKLN